MTQQFYIEERYGDGECGPFAEAMNTLTGLAMVLFVVRETGDHPLRFRRHAAVEIAPGSYLDAFGLQSLDDIERRMECALDVVWEFQPGSYPFGSGPGFEHYDAEEFAEVVDHASQLLEIHGLEALRLDASALTPR